jgi:tetratricopeptide (TPR) repeat protein
MDAGHDPVRDRAEALYDAGRFEEAVTLLARALAENDQADGVRYQLAELLADSGNPAAALAHLETAARTPELLLLCAACREAFGELDSAAKLVAQLEEEPGLRPEVLSLKGRLALRRERSEEAEALFLQAIELDATCSSAWFGLALFQERAGSAEPSFGSLAKAFICAPQRREIAIALHERAVRGRKLREAEEIFRRASAARPLNRRVRYLLIDLLLRQECWVDAMDQIEAAIVDFGADAGMRAAAGGIRERLGPIAIRREGVSGPTVSLCMVVKNEREHLAKCLRNAKPFVDEIIVADTGSTDETKEIARIFGARVFDVVWEDDFSKVRNYSLSKAAGDWVLVLDADEVLSSADQHAFKSLLEGARTRLAAFNIQTRNYSNKVNTVGFNLNRSEYAEERGSGWYPSEKVRLFPNDPRIRFAYPVHELVEPSLKRIGLPILGGPVVVHHYGTLNDRAVAAKTATYRSLGRKKSKDAPAQTASLRERAVQAAQMGRFSEALKLWRKFVGMHPESTEAYVNMGSCCWSLGRFDEAVEWAEHALKMNPSLKEARFNLAYALLLKGKGVQALAILERLVLDEPDYPAARFMMCVTKLCAGDGSGGEAAWMALRTSPLGPYLGEALREVEKRLLGAGCIDTARRLTATLKGFSDNPSPAQPLAETHPA